MQPMQFSSCATYIGNHPSLLVAVRYAKTSTGQTFRQNPHALHISSPMTTSQRPAGELLAALVGIGTDGENLRTARLQLVGDGSKTLELSNAERSPVPAVEDEHDRFPAAIVRQAHRAAGGVRQREARRRLADRHQ